MRRVLAIDPGSTHLAVGIFEANEDVITLVWDYMFRVEKDVEKMAQATRVMKAMCDNYGITECLIEFQAPMGAAHVCHWYIREL
jgi:hypothetical protein